MMSRFIAPISRISMISVLAIGALSACVMDTGELPGELIDGLDTEQAGVLMADDVVPQGDIYGGVPETLETQDIGLAKVFRSKSDHDCVTVENTASARNIWVRVQYRRARGARWNDKLIRRLHPGEEICTCVPDSFKLRVIVRTAARRHFSIQFHEDHDH